MKTLLAISLAALFVGPAPAQNRPATPNPPQGTVLQSISQSSYQTPGKLDPKTKLPAATLPPGLTLLCHFYGEAQHGNSAFNSPADCPLPVGAKIDFNYQQATFNPPCAGGGAYTPLQPSDIPAGIHIQCDGGYYWSVIGPIRLEVLQSSGGNVTQWGVHITNLYCGPGTGNGDGCNVKLDVYAKLQP